MPDRLPVALGWGLLLGLAPMLTAQDAGLVASARVLEPAGLGLVHAPIAGPARSAAGERGPFIAAVLRVAPGAGVIVRTDRPGSGDGDGSWVSQEEGTVVIRLGAGQRASSRGGHAARLVVTLAFY